MFYFFKLFLKEFLIGFSGFSNVQLYTVINSATDNNTQNPIKFKVGIDLMNLNRLSIKWMLEATVHPDIKMIVINLKALVIFSMVLIIGTIQI